MAAKKYSPKLTPIASAVQAILVGATVASGGGVTGDESGIESTKRGYRIRQVRWGLHRKHCPSRHSPSMVAFLTTGARVDPGVGRIETEPAEHAKVVQVARGKA